MYTTKQERVIRHVWGTYLPVLSLTRFEVWLRLTGIYIPYLQVPQMVYIYLLCARMAWKHLINNNVHEVYKYHYYHLYYYSYHHYYY